MKYAYIFAAALALAAVSCVPESNTDDPNSANPYPTTTNVVLNEIDGNSKLIEIYNGTSSAVSLTGWTIVKDGTKTVWTGVKGQVIASKTYVVLNSVDLWDLDGDGVISDTEKDASYNSNMAAGLIFDSGISAKKSVQIKILDASGNAVDTFERGAEPWGSKGYFENTESSFSRVPTGTGVWKYAAPTAGKPNPDTETGEIEQVTA